MKSEVPRAMACAIIDCSLLSATWSVGALLQAYRDRVAAMRFAARTGVHFDCFEAPPRRGGA